MGRQIKDVTGEVYTNLTITGLAPTKVTESGNRYKRVYTKCICGTEGESSYADLKRGKVKSCGCIKPVKLKVEPGMQYGHWTVLREATPYITKDSKLRTRVWVRCKCGVEKEREFSSIVSGKSNSCGCRGIDKEIKIPNPPPLNTEDEIWVNLLSSDIHWVSSKGRRYIQTHGKYYSIKKAGGYNGLDKGFYWWAKSIYKSFNGDWDNKKYRLVILDNSYTNLKLNNLYLAPRVVSGSNPDWLTYLKGNTKRSEQEGVISKLDILKLYTKQKGKSFYLGLEMDLTCKNDLLAVSVDRLDNSKGYTKDNVALCTRFENMGRRHNSVKAMLNLVNMLK